jgi:hypothetical protein
MPLGSPLDIALLSPELRIEPDDWPLDWPLDMPLEAPDSLGIEPDGVSLPLVGVLLVNPSVVTNVSVGVPLGPVV